VFLQVTADDTPDIAIPGRAYTFAELKRAQAIGDYESLVAHGRPVRRVHLGPDVARGLQRLRLAAVEATLGVAARR
jgi:transaldolase/glucose-6-phosphate isomerase